MMTTPQETFEAYTSAWNVSDGTERHRLLEKCWTEDGIYCDRNALVEGRQALWEHIGDFTARFAGCRIILTSGLDMHHDKIRFGWAILNAEEKILIEGVDFGVLDPDNRLKSITGFTGPLPALQ